jgi:hypothetical protein
MAQVLAQRPQCTWTRLRKPERVSKRFTAISPSIRGRERFATVERIIDRSTQLEFGPNSGARLTVFADDEVRELLERPYRTTAMIILAAAKGCGALAIN